MMLRYFRRSVLRVWLLIKGEEIVWAGAPERGRTIRSVMEVFISIVVLVCYPLVLFLGDLDPSATKLFSGFFGMVIGYWLRPD